MCSIRRLSDEGNQIGINILVQNRTIAQNTTLRVDVFNGVLGSDSNNLLLGVVASQSSVPNVRAGQFLSTQYN